MYRISVCAGAVLLIFGIGVALAADDSETCYKLTGDEAIAACGRQISRNPNDAVARHNRGVEYEKKGDYDRAFTDYDQAIRLNPQYALAYHGRANAWRHKGDYDRAIADYDQEIRLNPANAEAYNGRGNIWYDKGNYDRAIADYDQAIRIDPKFAQAYGNRGGAYENKNDYDRAIASYDESLRLDPNYAFARDGRARVSSIIASRRPAEQPQPVTVPAERRVALVIGNSRYRAVDLLPNPKRDAEAVAAALRDAGFQAVMVRSDLGRDALRDALRTFRAEADAADWALIYYAGHGIQINGANYVIPIDAKLHDERDVKGETVAYDELEETVRGASALRIIILDACRNDPFAAQMVRHNPDHAINRGLRPPPEGRPGLLVVYSARDGQVAEDGDREHSPFATALIARVRTPGREVRRMFDDVSDDVLEATGNRQQPFTYGRLPGKRDFFFVAGK
jgi:tetratricopeptide (TPR) repeat protein